MPRSQQPKEAEARIIDEIKRLGARIVVDVGCGDGRWAELLKGVVDTVAGMEIWPEYISKFKLYGKYDELFCVDAADFILNRDFLRAWPCDAIIFSDVIEHMEKSTGKAVLQRVKAEGVPCFLSIPTGGKTEQDGAVYGNPYESHISFWNHDDVIKEDFALIHEGTNPNGLVTIGTYKGAWNDRQR